MNQKVETNNEIQARLEGLSEFLAPSEGRARVLGGMERLFRFSLGRTSQLGNVYGIDENTPGITTQDQTYCYDYLNRLSSATNPGGWTPVSEGAREECTGANQNSREKGTG